MTATAAERQRFARHLRITGLVQGVGYRAAFEHQARALHLAGWVRNRLDGSVEALVCGDATSLERLIAWARQGPGAARVEQVSVSEADDSSINSNTFERLPTI